MKLKLLTGLIAATAMLATVPPASAQSMFDDFESYNIGTVGGQGGWEGWTGSPVAGNVTTALAFSGTKSLRVIKGNDTVRPFSVNSGGWVLSMMQYIPSTTTGSTWVILLNKYGANLDWSAQTLADISGGLIGEFEGSGGGSAVVGTVRSLVKDAWIPLRYEIDLGANSVSAYYNNNLLGTHPWQYTGVNALAALDIYPDEGATSGQVGPVYYDDVRLQPIPEPATAGLMLVGGLALLALRRK